MEFNPTAAQCRHRFQQLMSIYRSPFYPSDAFCALVEQTYVDYASIIIQGTHLIAEEGNCETSLKHFHHHRVPIYYGSPQSDLYDSSSYQDWYEPLHPYGILSPTRVFKTSPMYVGPNDNRLPFWISILHLWGPNFESTKTRDFSTIVRIDPSNNSNIHIREDLYANRIEEMTRMMQTAIDHLLKQQTTPQQIEIRLPRVGLGAFLTSLPPKARKTCVSIWLDRMNRWAKTLDTTRIRLVLCSLEPIPLKYTNIYEHCQRNLFDFSNRPDVHVLLINAWDPVSFIGNGGGNDATIDGMVAGGAMNLFWSSAYLSNPQLCPTHQCLSYQSTR